MTETKPIAFPFDGDIPAEGIWEDVDEPTYRGWPSFAQSDFKDHLNGEPPAKVDWRRQHPKRDTESTYLGTGLHTCLFEQKRFEQIVIPPPINKSTGKPYGDDTKAYKEHADAHPGCILIDEDGIRLIKLLYERILKIPEFREDYEDPESLREVALSFYLPLRTPTGAILWVAGKGRVDLWNTSRNRAWDIKTLDSATESAFGLQAGKYGYHYQATYYSMGIERLDFGQPDFRFLACEKIPTHQVVPYYLTKEDYTTCNFAIQRTLLVVAECCIQRSWPGVSTEPRPLRIPRHFMPKLTEAEYFASTTQPAPIEEDPIFAEEEAPA